VQIVGLFLSIFGIPVAIAVGKALGTIFNPINKKCVHRAVADELERKKGESEVAKYSNE